jgi:hypothetical protein
MAGNSFMVTVSAPKAPCRQTQTSVNEAHRVHGPAQPLRRCWRQASTVRAMMSTPTPVAR